MVDPAQGLLNWAGTHLSLGSIWKDFPLSLDPCADGQQVPIPSDLLRPHGPTTLVTLHNPSGNSPVGLQDAAGSGSAAPQLSAHPICSVAPCPGLHSISIFKCGVDGSLDVLRARRDLIRLGGPQQSRQGPHLPV